jgi:hypothetical protein
LIILKDWAKATIELLTFSWQIKVIFLYWHSFPMPEQTTQYKYRKCLNWIKESPTNLAILIPLNFGSFDPRYTSGWSTSTWACHQNAAYTGGWFTNPTLNGLKKWLQTSQLMMKAGNSGSWCWLQKITCGWFHKTKHVIRKGSIVNWYSLLYLIM